jgi:hypothetical protein
MRSYQPVPNFVIRMSGVSLRQRELETTLGITLDRYEPSDDSSYAQVGMRQGGDDWSSVAEFLEMIGPRVKELIGRRAIGSATMDVALPFRDNMAAISLKLPARIALLARY